MQQIENAVLAQNNVALHYVHPQFDAGVCRCQSILRSDKVGPPVPADKGITLLLTAGCDRQQKNGQEYKDVLHIVTLTVQT